MLCHWPQSQEGDRARPHLCKLARHGKCSTCSETVHQRPCMTREIKTILNSFDCLIPLMINTTARDCIFSCCLLEPADLSLPMICPFVCLHHARPRVASQSQLLQNSNILGRKAWVQISAATLSCNSLSKLFSVHTQRASGHQAAKLVASLYRVARVTAGLAESHGNLPLTAAPECNRVWATVIFLYTSGLLSIIGEAKCRPTHTHARTYV